MKKLVIGTALFGLLLAGCSEEAVKIEDNEATEVKPVDEAKKDAEKEQAEKERKEADEKAAAEEKKNASEAAYSVLLQDYMGQFATALTDFGNLNIQASTDPTLMQDIDWITDAAVALSSMDEIILKVNELNPPDKFKEVHAELLKAMDGYQYVVDNYPEAVDYMDLDLMEQCVIKMEESADYLEGATNMLLELI